MLCFCFSLLLSKVKRQILLSLCAFEEGILGLNPTRYTYLLSLCVYKISFSTEDCTD